MSGMHSAPGSLRLLECAGHVPPRTDLVSLDAAGYGRAAPRSGSALARCGTGVKVRRPALVRRSRAGTTALMSAEGTAAETGAESFARKLPPHRTHARTGAQINCLGCAPVSPLVKSVRSARPRAPWSPGVVIAAVACRQQRPCPPWNDRPWVRDGVHPYFIANSPCLRPVAELSGASVE